MSIYLFDWGNTLMVDYVHHTGKMCDWPQVSSVTGAHSLLHFLSRDSDVYIATNAEDSQQQDVRAAFARIGLDRYISGYFCKDSLGISKDSPDYYRVIASQLGVEPSQLTMVGDTFDKDITPALAAGLRAVWLSQSAEFHEPGDRWCRIETLLSLITQDFPVLDNERIRLEPPAADRNHQILDTVQRSYQELAQFLPWVNCALTIEETDQNIQMARYHFQRGESEFRFTIVDKQTDQVLGMIGLLIADLSVPHFEIGYWLSSEVTGHGIMRQAVALLETFAADRLGARRIDIRAVGRNIRSQKVALGSGYRLEAHTRLSRRNPDGRLDDELLFSKLF